MEVLKQGKILVKTPISRRDKNFASEMNTLLDMSVCTHVGEQNCICPVFHKVNTHLWAQILLGIFSKMCKANCEYLYLDFGEVYKMEDDEYGSSPSMLRSHISYYGNCSRCPLHGLVSCKINVVHACSLLLCLTVLCPCVLPQAWMSPRKK